MRVALTFDAEHPDRPGGCPEAAEEGAQEPLGSFRRLGPEKRSIVQVAFSPGTRNRIAAAI